MYFPQNETAQAREHRLNNLLGISSACFEAGRRLSGLVAATGRDALHDGSKQFAQFSHGQIDSLVSLPAILWLNNSARALKLLDATWETLGEAHRSLIQSAEAQVDAFDEIFFAAINQSAKNNPREIEIAHSAMRATLESAENEGCQISEKLTENSPGKRPNTRGRTTTR